MSKYQLIQKAMARDALAKAVARLIEAGDGDLAEAVDGLHATLDDELTAQALKEMGH